VQAIEAIAKEYEIKDLSQIVEASILLLRDLNKKVHEFEAHPGPGPTDPQLVSIMQTREFVHVMKSPVKTKYDPGIVDQVSYPDGAPDPKWGITLAGPVSQPVIPKG
jgi:hypothetical protein